MDKKIMKPNEVKIEVSDEVAIGRYSNVVGVAHSPGEFFLDFIALNPNMPKARVVSRIIMNPENAKNFLLALTDNIQQYEKTFGPITLKVPVKGGGNGEIPNPFMA